MGLWLILIFVLKVKEFFFGEIETQWIKRVTLCEVFKILSIYFNISELKFTTSSITHIQYLLSTKTIYNSYCYVNSYILVNCGGGENHM